MGRRGRAFTLMELIVVLMIILTLIAILLPSVHGTHRANNRVRCASNLRQIGNGIMLYMNANGGAFPRTRASIEPDAGTRRVPGWGTGAAAADPFAPDGPAENDVTAPLFLLLRAGTFPARLFVCPASNHSPDPLAGDGTVLPLTRSNFTDVKKHLSYSYQNPYPNNSTVSKAFSGQVVTTSDFALLADRNPGAAGGNSLNHDLKGQNVLYADGHVTWQLTPLVGRPPRPGATPDHIYNTADGKIVASPATYQDNILLPTDD